jgi:hypothetical protein
MGLGKGTLWKGKYFSLPQAASSIDTSGLTPVQLGSDNRVALLGDFTGLIAPKTATKIGTPSLIKQLIHPDYDKAITAAQLLFAPSPGMPGASEVFLIPVNSATPSILTISNTLKLTSYMYGLAANQISAKVEAGTGAVGKKVTVVFQGNTEVYDKMTKGSFTMQYSGTAGTCAVAVTVNTSTGTATMTTTTAGASVPADNISLDLTIYNTLQKVVDAINAKGNYTAAIAAGASGSDLSTELDSATVADCKATASTLNSDLMACVNGINKLSGYVSASRAAYATSAAPASAVAAYMTGGTSPVASNNDWAEAISLMESMDIDIIVPLTTTSSIQQSVLAHCNWMSGPNGKSERRQFIGGDLLSWASEATRITSLATLKALAKTFNNDRTVLAGLGCKVYNTAGVSTLYDASVTACMYAGIAAGSTPVEPLTRKYLNCIGLEVELRASEIDDLIEAGVAVPIPDKVQGAGYVVSRQVTTWSQDVDLYRIEYSVGRGADYIASQVRQRHELIIGQPGSEGMDATIINLTNGVLAAAKRDGYIRDYDSKATQLRVDGVTRYVDYSAMPILPINWVFSTFHIQPVSFIL